MSDLEGAVHQAELTRVRGDFREAIEQARAKGTLTREEIAGKPDGELREIMELWRVWEVSLLSVSQKQIGGKAAARFLREAREVVEQYYYDPHAWEVAKAMKTDAHGNEYQMASEMCRDEGKLHLYIYHLTLEPSQLQLAIESFDEAVNLAEQGTSAFAVATMEREMVGKEQGKPINFEVFTEAYKSAVELAPQAGGWDRLAAISWWYTRESLLAGNREGILLGATNLLKAVKEGKQNPLKFVAKDLARPVMDRVKRLTVGETLEGSGDQLS